MVTSRELYLKIFQAEAERPTSTAWEIIVAQNLKMTSRLME
jgi:hypothetical protein